MSASIFHSLRFRYAIGLMLVACLTGSAHLITASMVHSGRDAATEINIAGRQRMLSQKIAKAASQLMIAVDSGDSMHAAEIRQELGEASALWEASHRALMHGDEAMGLSGLGVGPTFESLVEMTPLIARVVAASERLVDLAGDAATFDVAAMMPSARTIDEQEKVFLPQMNDIVFALDREATASTSGQQHLQTFFLALTVLALLAEALLIFEPTVRLVRRTMRRLDTLRSDAEAESAQRLSMLHHNAHELRTPLAAIVGYADLLDDPALDTAERASAVETIRIASRHMLGIVNTTLDAARAQAGRSLTSDGEFEPAACARAAISMLTPLAARKGIALKVETAGLRDIVKGDGQRFTQVLINLVGNAVKFTDEGSVVLRIGSVRGDHLGVEVADTGAGMTADQVSNLFRPFERGTTSQSGTGLGLNISRLIVREMGGDITVRSELGIGTVFSFEVAAPVIERDTTIASVSNGLSGGDLRLDGIRVLLAEDCPDNARLTMLRLRQLGATVTHAKNGAIALDHAASAEPYDIILMDLHMPEVSGLDATKRLRAGGDTRPILALTAGDGDREASKSAGMTGYVVKPFEMDTLAGALLQASGRRGSPAGASEAA